MSHELENVGTLDFVGLVGQQAWHNLGVLINDGQSAVDAGESQGMFWPVAQYQLQAIALDGSIVPIASHVANVRTKDLQGNSIQHLLGVVGADYSVCQNRELAEFTDALAQSGKVTIETVGSIRGGKRVWFLAKGESFNIGGTDEIVPYVLVSNGHDGTQAIRVTPTTVRVVCSNTLHMVVPRVENTAFDSAAITIRHSGKISDKLQQAKAALEYYGATLSRNRELFELLNAKKMDQQQGLALFANSYAKFWETATADELGSTDDETRRVASNRLARMEKASELFLQRYADEQSKVGIGGSAWAYFNAMTGYVQHDSTARGKDDTDRVARRMESNLFGLNSNRTLDVLAMAMAS